MTVAFLNLAVVRSSRVRMCWWQCLSIRLSRLSSDKEGMTRRTLTSLMPPFTKIRSTVSGWSLKSATCCKIVG